MEVITNREIYSNFKNKEQRQAKRQAKNTTKERGGRLKKVVNSNLGKALIGGLSDYGKQFSQNSNVQFDPSESTNTNYKAPDGSNLPDVKNVKEGMSTTTKVIIGLLVVGGIGAGVYFGFFHKKGKSGAKVKK